MQSWWSDDPGIPKIKLRATMCSKRSGGDEHGRVQLKEGLICQLLPEFTAKSDGM